LVPTSTLNSKPSKISLNKLLNTNKVKDNIAPCFFNYKVHHEDLISALEEAESLTSCPGRFIPGETAPVSIVQEAGWAPDPTRTLWRFGLNFMVKLKISCPILESNPGHLADSPLLCQLNYPGSYWMLLQNSNITQSLNDY
jgi:hypothetical protein